MKIVITNHEFRAHFPPRIKYFYEEAKRQGHEVHVIELYGISICYQFSSDHDTMENYWEILFPDRENGKVSNKEVEAKLTERLDAINPDVVIAGIPTFPVGIITLRWAKRNNKAIVHYGDALKHTFKHPWWVHYLKRMMFRNSEAFLAPAPAWKESMEYWGYKEEELFYGLDVANNKEWEGELVNESFKDLPPAYFVNCCRQVGMKNLPFLLNAYLRYQKEGGALPLLMIGEGVKHDELVRLADNNTGIIFLPYLNHKQMREIFAGMKALFVPSFKEETWGITVNEAMAANRIAAVSKEVGCASTLIEDGMNGFCYDPRDEDGIVAVMHKIESLPKEKLQEMQANAKNTIQDWGVERFAKGALEACHYAINHKKRIRNPFNWLLIKLWKGRMTIKNE